MSGELLRATALLRILILPATAVLAPAMLPGQESALGTRTGTARQPFSRVTSLQELPDGRVVVTDPIERKLAVVNFMTGETQALGAQGAGPNEFGSVGQLMRGIADTLFMLDFSQGRMLLVSPQGVLAGTRPLALSPADTAEGEKVPAGASRLLTSPRYMDASGRAYMEVSYIDRVQDRGVLPEGILARHDPVSGKTVVAAPLQRWYPALSSRWRAPFMAGDVWAVAPDGAVARVVPAPYHVEWYREGRLVSAGPEVQYSPVAVTQQEQEEWLAARASRGAGGAIVSGPPSTGDVAGSRQRAAAPGSPESQFPKLKPAFVEEFVGDAVKIGPGSELWVTLAVAHRDSVARVDVFDASGARLRRVTLPPNRKLAGVGASAIYLLRIDDDGLQWLERYAKPRGRSD